MSDDLSMEVKFEQTFTIYPPEYINDPVTADAWFHDDPEQILRDALDIQQGNVEVLHIND